MIKNFFIIAIRNLRRNKIFSTINIMGLSIGMASAILIGVWIQDELSFDRFYAKKDRLYMAYRLDNNEGKGLARNFTTKVLASTLKKDYPEIEDVAHWQ